MQLQQLPLNPKPKPQTRDPNTLNPVNPKTLKTLNPNTLNPKPYKP